jgi:hypothetical protein
MAFLVGGANSSAAVAYDIDNSLRFNDGDSPDLGITLGTPSTANVFTFSFWFKLGDWEASKVPFSAGTDSNNFDCMILQNNGKIIFFQKSGGSTTTYLMPNALYRDTSAWYHLVVGVDTTQSTDTNRIKMYVNGSQISSFETGTYCDQNEAAEFNTAVSHTVGTISMGDTHSDYMDGYLADFYFIDGTQYAASDFGETDSDSGIWKPKEASVTFGDNGFFLEFKGTGASQDSSGIGADTSGEDNHLAVTNLAATDQCTDTPTNNFCTLNPLVPRHANFTLNEGNCGILQGHDNNFVWGTMPGKMDSSDVGWYFELRLGAAPVGATGYGLGVGVGDFDYAVGTEGLGTDGGWYMSSDTVKSMGTNFAYTANYSLMDNGGGNRVDLSVDTNVGEIIQVAWKNSKVFLGVNNTWYAADAETDGDPANGNNPSHTISSTYNGDNWMPILNSSLAGAALSKFNFGNPPFSISSGNADANGYGNFEYAPPSGFYALCTKNLAEYG